MSYLLAEIVVHDLPGNALVSRLLSSLQILSQMSYWPTFEDCFHLCEDGNELLICESEVLSSSLGASWWLISHLSPRFPQSVGILLGSSSIGSYVRKDNWISVAETPVCPRSGTML